MRSLRIVLPSLVATALLILAAGLPAAEQGTHPYDGFEKDDFCGECHVDLAGQQRQSLMTHSFTHPWDEIEYFELALPHSEKEPKVAGIKAGCIGCHAPLAYLAGDIPPQRPAAGTRANEGVSCDLCHSIVGFEGDVPFNGNFVVAPGEAVQGTRSDSESMGHSIEPNPFLESAEFCGTCHNEKDPYGVWVKSTQLEWQESPQAEAGIVCQDCHMPPAAGNSAPDFGGVDRPDIRQHLFHGAHDRGKLAGVVEVRIHPRQTEVKAGESAVLTATVVNAKAGHKVPSGSAEERVLWLHVEAKDAAGNVYPLPVDRKGFAGEDWTIADSSAIAYQAMGEIQGIEDFPGVSRDGLVPDGDRIFRLPYLDPQGRMTIAQWYTASLGPDYRLAPLEARNETYTWQLPETLAAGEVEITATVWYALLVSSVAEHLGVPEEEAEPVKVSEHTTTFVVARGS
jgi:hypothetical protein